MHHNAARIYRSMSAVGKHRISIFLFWYVCISWNTHKLMYFDCQCRYAVGMFWRIVWTNYAYTVKTLWFTRISIVCWKLIVWTDTNVHHSLLQPVRSIGLLPYTIGFCGSIRVERAIVFITYLNFIKLSNISKIFWRASVEF